MRLEALRCTPFKVPLRRSLATAALAMTAREGLILRLETVSGAVGLGEAAPLQPPPGAELHALAQHLEALGREMRGRPLHDLASEVTRWLGGAGHLAAAMLTAIRAGLDTAVCDAEAREAGLSLARHLSDGAITRVPVNALIHAPSPEDAAREAADAVARGFATVKLKVGLAATVKEERRRVEAVRAALGPGIRLRLDANGTWSVARAVTVIRALEPCGLELVEQPVPPGDTEALRQVRARVGVAIAADEAVTSVEAAKRLLKAAAADVLVLKPMVIGGLQPARQIAEAARAAGCRVIVTTTLDTGVGTAAALHLAATRGKGAPACGIATADMLETTLVSGLPPVRDGAMAVSVRPGLGIELDEDDLLRYRLVD